MPFINLMAVIIDTLPVIISVDSKCYDETSAYCIDENRKRFQFIYIHLFPVKTFDMMTAKR